jgi:hypothetical protein
MKNPLPLALGLLMIAILALVVGVHTLGTRADTFSDERLLTQARERSQSLGVDYRLGREDVYTLPTDRYLQMHGAYAAHGTVLDTASPIYVYRVYGAWKDIPQYNSSIREAEVLELAFSTETGALVLMTQYPHADQAPDLVRAAENTPHAPTR